MRLWQDEWVYLYLFREDDFQIQFAKGEMSL